MDVQELVRVEEKLYRDRSWAELGELYADDVELISADGSVIRGRDNVLAYFRSEEDAFTDTEFTAELVATEADLAVLTWTWSGTHAQDFVTPSGRSIPATGNRISIDAVSLARTRDGRFTSFRRYHDRLGMLVQLGVMAMPGSDS